MERNGLLYRAPDPSDNRYMRLFVTAKGKTLAHTMPGKIARFESWLIEGLKDKEIIGLHRYFPTWKTGWLKVMRDY